VALPPLGTSRSHGQSEASPRSAHRDAAPVPVPKVIGEPTHFLGFCLRCDAGLWVHSAKSRVPVCRPKLQAASP
jgi:hypothetical protein